MVCCKNNLCCKESSLSWWKNNFWKAADDRPLISAKNQTFQNENGMPYQKDSQFPTDLVLVCFGCGFWPILSRKATTMRPFGALLQFQFCHYCLILDTACKVHDFLRALLEASKDLSRMCKAFIYNYTYNSYAYSFIHIYTVYINTVYIYTLYTYYTPCLFTFCPPLHRDEFFAPGQHGVPKLWRGWRNTRPQWQHPQRKNQCDSRGIDGLQEQPEQFRFRHLANWNFWKPTVSQAQRRAGYKKHQKMGCFRLSFHLLVPCLISVLARKDCQDTVCMEAQDQISKGPF